MDKSKLFFYLGAGALVIGGSFTAGIYSTVRENVAYRAVWGSLDQAKTLVEELPNLRGTEPIHFLRPAKYPGQGVTINEIGGDDLILLSGFINGNNRVQLMQRDGTVLNDWELSAKALFPDASFFRDNPATDWNAITHGTIITPSGDIVFSFESGGMARLDRCGKPVWTTPGIVNHHSPNWLADGGVVVSGGQRVEKPSNQVAWPFSGPYWEDLVFKYTADGEKVFEKALTELFIENDLQALMTSTGTFKTRVPGEFHLNEVEELSAALAPDFPMFEAGDLMLSLRNRNMIVVTDPAVTTIKWLKIGPFIRQHDPDFQPGGMITVFDNHSDESLDGTRGGGSRIWQIDPATDQAVTLYGGREDQFMYSPERSTHQLRENGNLMITEAQSGRAFEVTSAGKTVWEYINRYDSDSVTWVHNAEVFNPSYFTVTDWGSCG
ncbi:MAG: arylsulfotransferase family protein [Albidovulum sp.]